ncbi:TerC family protein [Chlorobium phaeobacteroides]|jgi:YkoY family integral membrane protein|uniref:Integral membrane protein TerC n=1 Tax=Chlorobium phaeobacteroides (strain DSM 266 / SMG 266 / 2430) TaxID=290317 RepID=A1BHB6_CHLPD|nr:TerC family protein [Chlorobium phaeobacteroides]ABL65793.1 Integral membrane protein TerC [Chlorobium phaeobacteroides DSM 266]MBV5326080.1 TerC family protein [Chlorobium sp.]
MNELFLQIIDNPTASFLIVLNLVLIESLLSVDNAAVLATMVMDLPPKERSAALKYGIIGAYLFRGLCLLFAAFLVKIWWLKPLGGIYLLYLVWNWIKGKKTVETKDDYFDKQDNWFYKHTVGSLGVFWSTVILIELMDLAFSIDNIFAAVAFTDNIILIWFGVFIGILAMRFVAQGFVRLMELYPFLETCAFIVIGVLGVKLSVSVFEHFYPQAPLSRFLQGHEADIITSAVTVAIFLVPVLTSLLFNIPARNSAGKSI